MEFIKWQCSNSFQCSFLASWFKYNINTLYQLMLVCLWLYPALSTSVRNNKLVDNRNFQFSMFYGSTLFSNGSWISVWNIKFRGNEKIVELKGKILVSLISCVWLLFPLFSISMQFRLYSFFLSSHWLFVFFFCTRWASVILKREMSN